MKTILISLGFIAQIGFINSQVKPKIAVADPSVQGLYATPQTAGKLLRLELINLSTYSVYDEFDMNDLIRDKPEFESNCLGLNCLVNMGETLGADFMLSGSIDGLGNKIVISLKIIDVKNKTLHLSGMKEFDNQEAELQRMIRILLDEMHGKESQKDLVDRLKYKDELITSTNVGKINNNGPRVGYGFMTGSMYEFATRPSNQGGLEIFPGVSMIGYQFEGQYVGTENFSALVEGIINFTGMEQGIFIPSLTLLNGFRFGKAGWEIAFGPGLTLRKQSEGFFDKDDVFHKGANHYFSRSDWEEYTRQNNYTDTSGNFILVNPSDISDAEYTFEKHFDSRGEVHFATLWVIGVGRTFRAGALNIPVNVFYSSVGKGGMAGLSVGFNVQKKKKPINPKA